MDQKPSVPPLSSTDNKLERKSSIDTEPKTLLQEELDSARKAALEIINKHTKEEALRLFLELFIMVLGFGSY
ncbi:hypothetical protein ACB092_12G131800 [Castanea dentata]